jgi:hypothetical protein
LGSLSTLVLFFLTMGLAADEFASIPHPARKFSSAMQVNRQQVKIYKKDATALKSLVSSYILANSKFLKSEDGPPELFWINFETLICALNVKDAYKAITMLNQVRTGKKANPLARDSKALANLKSSAARLIKGNNDEKRFGWMLSYSLAHSAASMKSPQTEEYLHNFALIDNEVKNMNWRAVKQIKFIPSIITAKNDKGNVLKTGAKLESNEKFLTVNKSALRSSASLKQIYTIDDDKGKSTVAVKTISCKIGKGPSHRSTIFDFDMDLSIKANISFSEVISMLKSRYPFMEPGKQVMFSVSQELNKDSRSSGLGLSLLLASIYEGVELSPNIITSSDISLNGKVLSGYDITEKIKFAGTQKNDILLVSTADYKSILDSFIIWGHTALWSSQIIAVRDMNEALEIARKDHKPGIQKALDEFKSIQRLLRINPNRFVESNTTLIKQLAAITKKLPTHASALAMYNILRGVRPKELSLNTSIELFFKTCRPSLDEIFEEKKALTATKKRSNTRLKQIKRVLNKVMHKLVDAMIVYNNSSASDQSKAGFMQTWVELNKNRKFVDLLR